MSAGETLNVLPLSAAENAGRLPVAVLSGFLGSGKTTLLNRLLQDPRLANTAVAINEFGAVPLDQHLIDYGEDKTVVMASGCLCCNLAGDMEEAPMRIFSPWWCRACIACCIRRRSWARGPATRS